MVNRRNNSLFFRILSSKLFFIIFFIIVIYLSINVYHEIKQRVEVKREISSLKMEINNLQKENRELDGLIKYFETEEYIESASRQKLGYIKPGEKIIVFTEEGRGDILSIQQENLDNKLKTNGSNIKSWWNYFFNNNK